MKLPKRHAISRARFFLDRADACTYEEHDDHEAFLEAAIIFARTALNRLNHVYGSAPGWRSWFAQYLAHPSYEFIKSERDYILKEASPKVGQILVLGGPGPGAMAKDRYYYDGPGLAAVDTVRRHVEEIARIVESAATRFV